LHVLGLLLAAEGRSVPQLWLAAPLAALTATKMLAQHQLLQVCQHQEFCQQHQ
jgi:hypothetical protein